jgi:hypothetical protein
MNDVIGLVADFYLQPARRGPARLLGVVEVGLVLRTRGASLGEGPPVCPPAESLVFFAADAAQLRELADTFREYADKADRTAAESLGGGGKGGPAEPTEATS